jgi:hypothetical protein
MGLFADPVSAVAEGVSAITGFVGRFFPDKSQIERDKAQAELQVIMSDHAESMAQIAVDAAEATSPDRLNHWRGALGWVVSGAFAWHYIVLRMLQWLYAFCIANGWAFHMPSPPDLTQSELSTLWELAAVMLGSHAVPHITGAVGSLMNRGTAAKSEG